MQILKEFPSLKSFFPFSQGYFEYVNKDIEGTLLVFEENGIILPIILKKKWIFKIGYFLYPPTSSLCNLSTIEEEKFMMSFYRYIKINNVVNFINPPLHFNNFSYIPSGAKSYNLGIIKVRLKDRSLEDIYASFKPVYRRYINKAVKDGIEIEYGEHLIDDFYDLYSKRLSSEASIYDSKEKVIELLDNSKKENYCVDCGIVKNNDKIDAVIFNVYDSQNAYYLLGAINDGAHNGSFRLLHWDLIKKYSILGLNSYQLGGLREGDMLTKKHGNLASFKLGFGADVLKGSHFIMIINPIMYFMYNLLLKIKLIFLK